MLQKIHKSYTNARSKYLNILPDRATKKFMMKCVDVEELLVGIVTDETVKARLWLAIFEIKAGNYQLAYDYAMGVSSGTSQEIEEARMLARECRRHM